MPPVGGQVLFAPCLSSVRRSRCRSRGAEPSPHSSAVRRRRAPDASLKERNAVEPSFSPGYPRPATSTRYDPALVIRIRPIFLMFAAIGVLLAATSAGASPDLRAKQDQAHGILAQIQALDQQVNSAAERFNGANYHLKQLSRELRMTRRDLARARSMHGVAHAYGEASGTATPRPGRTSSRREPARRRASFDRSDARRASAPARVGARRDRPIASTGACASSGARTPRACCPGGTTTSDRCDGRD